MTAPVQPTVSHPFWSLVDGAFVINLDARADRWAQFQTAVRDFIPAAKLQRFSACVGRELPGFGQRPWFPGGSRDHTWAGRAGCLLSHRRALLKSRELGWGTTLLLEDDAVFAPEFGQATEALAAASREYDWEVCYLGCTEPWAPGRLLTKLGPRHALHQIHGATTTHAYLVRAPARDWILAQLPDESRIWSWLAAHRAIDRWYQRQLGLNFRVGCVSPGLVNQSESKSDIATSAGPPPAATARAPATGNAAYYLGHACRRLSVRFGLLGDTLRGWLRRRNGF